MITELPDFAAAEVVVAAPAAGPGNWSGAADVILVDSVYWLTYRVRRPLAEGRGVSVVVARSEDGVRFDAVTAVHRDTFAAASFERPALVPLADGGWRLYLSCSTPDSKHWWIDSLEAADPADLASGTRRVVLPGSDTLAVKDPVIRRRGEAWDLWLCCHPLDLPGEEDRMWTSYLSSTDGLDWTDHGPVLTPRPGHWDARGARVTAVLDDGPLTVLYDGRPRAEDNWHETTGIAVARDNGLLEPVGDAPVWVSPDSDGACRYACAVPLPDGRTRFYAELARPDGAHDLVTVVAFMP